MPDWDDFQRLVDEQFGFSKRKLLRMFYREERKPGESNPLFISRMELTRAKLKANEEQCLTSFEKQLDKDFLRECELIRATRATLTGDKELTWELLV